ncbi:hypothetical protein GCM10027347_60580 [Larkinella harenae]
MTVFPLVLTQASAASLSETFITSAGKLIDTSVPKLLTFIPLMLFLHLLIALTKTYFGDMRFDPSGMIKVIFIWLGLAAYGSVVGAVYEATLWLANLVSGDGTDILKTLNTLSESTYFKQHSESLPFSDVKIPFDDMTSFFAWIVLAIENGLAMIIRIFIERIRAMLMGFILACGPIAFTIATIPGFGGALGHWARIFISTSLWTLTLGILDALMIGFITHFSIPSNLGPITSLQEAAGVLDLLVVNGVVILMYLSVPLLTSFYIGGHASASFLRAAQGYVAAGTSAGVVAYQNYNRQRNQPKKEPEVPQHQVVEST